ncbi:MAG: hypothetical protein ACREMT_08940, partial [Vulcanimicrobiaceae bacterium]
MGKKPVAVKKRERVRAPDQHRIRQLLMAAAVTAETADEHIAHTVTLGCNLLECESGAVFELDRAPSDSAIPERLCRLPLAGEGVMVLDDLAGLDYLNETADGTPSAFRSYIGAPINVRGAI